ncbi:MAG: hypothetical protein K6E32_05190, partial [Lachnospiraceae bacterium]|nr:hypothetical protein [Lachnospiraceae bacterium]
PELDPDVLLYEAAEAVVGSGHAKDLYDVLSLIQDARVGEDHGTFYETDENYIYLNGAKDPSKIIEECDAALTKLQNMIDADIHSNTLPLSVSVSDILKMMVPNVHQISEYAEFRLNYVKLTEMAETGKSKEELSLFIESFFKPVCEYNVVTGLWGLEEQRIQVRLMEEFCVSHGLEAVNMPLVDHYRKQRILGEMISLQQNSAEKVLFPDSATYQMDVAYGTENTKRLVNELVSEGLLTREGENKVYISDWERYIYNF